MTASILKSILAIAFTFIFSLSAEAKIYYVKVNGTGQGNSWDDAAGEINAVLFAAKPGDQIWVAAGTYYPTVNNDRNETIAVPDKVKVFGGFTGVETAVEQRNFEANVTVLSGEINTESPEDNSYNVVTFRRVTRSTELNGFTVRGGMGNGTGTTGDFTRCGGGIYNDGAGYIKGSNPTIANCIFENNQSRDGGAVYNNGIAGRANPHFINCIFSSNTADFDGGAVFNDGRKRGTANPTFADCCFIFNKANYGGGVLNYGAGGESSPKFRNCEFRANYAYKGDGAMYNLDAEGSSNPELSACNFNGNVSRDDKVRSRVPNEEIITAGGRELMIKI